MKKLLVLALLTASLCSFETLIRSSQPPQGHTGADGVYCNQCHSTNQLNNPGGSVQATGLPDVNYTAGAVYNFSITISHSAVDRKRWGFSIEARNNAGQNVGTFTTTNTHAAPNGLELSHLSAQTFATAASSYTYNNLTWTAPANPGPDDNIVTFYYVGNAANGNGFNTGDFIYSNTQTTELAASTTTYTFIGSGNWEDAANWVNGVMPPANVTGNATIIINPDAEGECVLNTVQQIGSGVTFSISDGKKFRITGNLTVTQ
jgi:hypothetical protein